MTYNEQKIQEEFRKMKATGIVRRIDDLGRVVIPKEIRKTLRIKEGTPLEIFTDREGQIILKKYSPIGELNTFAAEYAEALVQTTGLTACITDRDQVVAACGSGSRELEGKEISSDLDAVIAGRKGRMVSQDSRENISVISDAMDSFCQKMIQPILCASDAIGAVILLTKSRKNSTGRHRTCPCPHSSRFSWQTDGAVKVHQMYRKMCADQDINIRCRCQELQIREDADIGKESSGILPESDL